MTPTHVIPYAPRRQFAPLHDRTHRWAIAVTHRRAGKTVACVNELIQKAITCPQPRPFFAYLAPQLNQAKDIAWNYLLDFTRCFEPLRKVSATELWVELPPNRARIRIYGTENHDRLRGIGLDGVVLDEFGDIVPEAWSKVILPCLTEHERNGWAIFIGTPKGRNGFYRLWQQAETDPEWFRLMLRASDTQLLSQKQLADARRFMTDEEYAQEYECSFDAAVRGAYWGKEIAELEAQGRIGHIPWDPALPVHTAWDLGMADSTVVWFVQEHAPSGEIRVIDVIKGEGEGLVWYVKQLQDRPWIWGNHYFPHDVNVRELGTGQSRIEFLAGHGLRATVCPNLPVEDGIQAVRLLLPRCWFDREKCAKGLDALKLYRRDFDEKTQEFRIGARHDWTSHFADAFRYFAVARQPLGATRINRRRPRRDTSWVV
jgi:phage terminase large subunit